MGYVAARQALAVPSTQDIASRIVLQQKETEFLSSSAPQMFGDKLHPCGFSFKVVFQIEDVSFFKSWAVF